MDEKTLNIAVVDDHSFFRKGVVMTLGRFKYANVVFEASNGQEFLDLLDQHPVEVVLMDIKMPVMNGIEATEKALEKKPDLRIIAFSMFGDEDYLEKMLAAGISGFILKNIEKEGLDRALQAVADGRQYFSEELIPYFTQKYIKKDEPDANDDVALTKRELEVLSLIAEGFSNQEIADELFISIRTVTNHRANLNMKTGSRNTASLLAYAIKNNLIEM